MKIYIGSDHAGFAAKKFLMSSLQIHHQIVDCGPLNEDRTDYPDYADQVVGHVLKNLSEAVGILVCGSGQGMAMRANKYLQIRAALCWNVETARLSRQHNDANILCLGGRLLSDSTLIETAQAFLATSFEGGRHSARVQKISAPI